MGKLMEELIRKRAEHNDGILPDLEEISLHQEELEKIEALEQCCRHLKILLLQHNAISKMENISKLKELEYLNLSLNNIKKIENIAGCESLKKLDLTLNFVDFDALKESLENLQSNAFLEDLYLLGNPCTDFPGYRQYVAAKLPQLGQLDGSLISPQDRITANQELPVWEKCVAQKAREVALDKLQKEQSGYVPPDTSNAPETRLQMARELGAQKQEKEANEKRRMGTEKKEAKEIPGAYTARGDIRQCNEGKYRFRMDEIGDDVVFELETPKHLETGLIDVDVNPWYVRVICKEKLTQLKLPEEVNVCETSVQRSRVTGFLKIKMPKASAEKALGGTQDEDDWGSSTSSTSRNRNSGASTLAPLEPEGDRDVEMKDSSTTSRKNKTSAGGAAATVDKTSLTDNPKNGSKDGTKKKRPYNYNLFELHKDPIKRSEDEQAASVDSAKKKESSGAALVEEVVETAVAS
mmetsp:Transcript_12403/g.30089  ORF Transcript_12403/g.30089 Transcript_12403/m.30089 type:complete len:466 (-) Transcript_12403:147-1544(-)